MNVRLYSNKKNIKEHRPPQQLADPLDRMLTASAISGVQEDLHLEISVERAQEAFFSFLSNIFATSHFEPGYFQHTSNIKSMEKQYYKLHNNREKVTERCILPLKWFLVKVSQEDQ
jgi:hypothetical protein